MHIPVWFFLLMLLTVALPVTTPGLIGFAVGWLVARRKGRASAARAFKWCAVLLLPFWLLGAGFGGWWFSETMDESAKWARRNYTVHEATVIDGVDIPAGTAVSREDDGRLQGIALPEGKTFAANGTTWRGGLEFNGPRGQIGSGTLVADTVILGIPCRGGQRVIFESVTALTSCTLSRDAAVDATIGDAAGASRVQSFTCRAGTQIEMQFGRRGELGKCTLAAPAEIGGVTCADGVALELVNAMLSTCALAKQARFGPIDLPPGSSVTYIAGRPSSFSLPATGPAMDGFGLTLPAGTRAKFCWRNEELEHLSVDQTAYVAVEGLKLTGSIDFICAPSQSSSFQSGTLFEDSVVGGKQRLRGELVSRDDLSPR